jgi:hypothetical protein
MSMKVLTLNGEASGSDSSHLDVRLLSTLADENSVEKAEAAACVEGPLIAIPRNDLFHKLIVQV